ncbi:MAG: hypothetical protein JF597_14780 [Streptomyces sp.]|jgi:hypothetical protein|uniref:hypothetical protein n=1 Tax=Streptomyces sp. TaxID=1931 RepID=UPI0025DC4419|nr:hypothetical protein [Streptomyces sp.]MBW8794818.1 hypothetical protein [Streptomyces sp.]
MNQRKDTYRAALKRGPDAVVPRPVKVTHLHTRYVRLTIELDTGLPRDLVQWARSPVSAMVRAGAAALRPPTSAS